ncbi:MAG: hypothetical protein M0T84_07245 [Betaproteobacteria bacterium]|nr:hypothetical protein [Betaproteobacteria bacterium]
MNSKGPVFAQVKLVGDYARVLREESERRNVTLNALVSEYAMEGIEGRNAPDGDKLAGFERRIISTMVALRGDVESLTATIDVTVALVDALAKLLLVHLPEPAAESLDGVLASAQSRHENLLKSVALTGFDEDRPDALRRIVKLLSERLGQKEEKESIEAAA